jgi:hypothetical protein
MPSNNAFENRRSHSALRLLARAVQRARWLVMRIARILAVVVGLLLPLTAATQQKPIFVYVKINESITPMARGTKYGDPLDAALKSARLGQVTGGGSSLSQAGKVEWVGIDIDLTDVEKGIPLIRKTLIELGAPKGSSIEYEISGRKI